MVAARLATLRDGQRADRVGASIDAATTQDDAAELLNVSRPSVQRAQRNAYYEIGLDLRAIRDRRLYRQQFRTFEAYCEARWEWTRERCRQLIEAASAAEQMANKFGIAVLPAKERHVAPLLRIEADAERAAVWKQVLDDHADGRITAKDVEGAVTRFEAMKAKNWLTLDEWTALAEDERARALRAVPTGKTMNKQDNASIEWAQWSWNPVTGCRHDCPYCYARDIAERVYPQKFEPALYPEQLGVAHNTIGGWLVNSASGAELTNDTDLLPDAAVLDRVAQAIKDDAKGEVYTPPATPPQVHPKGRFHRR